MCCMVHISTISNLGTTHGRSCLWPKKMLCTSASHWRLEAVCLQLDRQIFSHVEAQHSCTLRCSWSAFSKQLTRPRHPPHLNSLLCLPGPRFQAFCCTMGSCCGGAPPSPAFLQAHEHSGCSGGARAGGGTFGPGRVRCPPSVLLLLSSVWTRERPGRAVRAAGHGGSHGGHGRLPRTLLSGYAGAAFCWAHAAGWLRACPRTLQIACERLAEEHIHRHRTSVIVCSSLWPPPRWCAARRTIPSLLLPNSHLRWPPRRLCGSFASGWAPRVLDPDRQSARARSWAPFFSTAACAAQRAPRAAGPSLLVRARLTAMFRVRFFLLCLSLRWFGWWGLAGSPSLQFALQSWRLMLPHIWAALCTARVDATAAVLSLLLAALCAGSKSGSLSWYFLVLSFTCCHVALSLIDACRLGSARAAEEGRRRWEGHLGRHHDCRRPRGGGHARPQLRLGWRGLFAGPSARHRFPAGRSSERGRRQGGQQGQGGKGPESGLGERRQPVGAS